ncbi:amino acid ABC transporter permease [Halotalea alkalilenta]|uniref:ABC transporter permease n=1 Tax=Halotalea alkalilenta TaxID=376489 RepID=A0A172YI44_9GAMM|nr:amino acid ABC transporter permease [Halotalea alkalilenta]ANF58911.1 ABC transporter permease [Halotalea alkalilenta]
MENWQIVWEARDSLISGLFTTIEIFLIGSVLAFLLGCLVVYLLEQAGPWLRRALRVAIDLMRTLPFLIFAYLLYYGLPSLGVRLDAWTAGLIALVIYHGAYFAEMLRGARLVMPAGGVEAARACGFHGFTLFRRILLPQLLIRVRPLIGNQLIYCLKDTAFLTIITVNELTAAANSIQATYFIPMEAFVAVIGLYWMVSIVIELLVKWAGRFGRKRGFDHV